MKIFLLIPTKKGQESQGYDCTCGYVVIAENEENARKLIKCNDECETEKYSVELGIHHEGLCYWQDPIMTTCVAIGESYESVEKIILEDFNAG